MTTKRSLHETPPFDPSIPEILQPERLYTLEVGSQVFRLSGASLSSDSPSYFTHYFSQYEHLNDQDRPTLIIDRSPKVFEYINRHLQGYHVQADDDEMLAFLTIDASYYNLKKLLDRIRITDYLVRIGGELFRLPQELFHGHGNSPNYLSVQHTSLLEAPRDLAFQGTMVRPVPAAPMRVADHSPRLFRDLVEFLAGSRSQVDNASHRELLIKEARYYRFRGLEQQLVPCSIQFNSFRGFEEIVLPVQYVAAAGLSIVCPHGRQSLHYKRPYIDNVQREIVLQFDAEEVLYTVASDGLIDVHHTVTVPPGRTLSSLKSIFRQVTLLMGLPAFAETNKFRAIVSPSMLDAAKPGVLTKSIWRICLEEPHGPCLELLKAERRVDEVNRWSAMPFV